MRQLAPLTVVLILVAAGAVSAIRALTATPSAPLAPSPDATISIQGIHLQVDMRSLPLLDVKDPI
jgi:hypothetical protein